MKKILLVFLAAFTPTTVDAASTSNKANQEIKAEDAVAYQLKEEAEKLELVKN